MRTKLRALFTAVLFALSLSFSAHAQDPLKERAGSRPGAVPAQPQTTQVSAPTQSQAAKVSAQAKPQTAQVSENPQVDYSDPDSFFDEGFVGAIKAGILAIIAALGAFIPGLRSVATSNKGGKLISAGVMAFLAITVLISFRAGGLTENFFNAITTEFLPNFAYSGLLYSVYKLIVGFFKRKDKEQTLTTS